MPFRSHKVRWKGEEYEFVPTLEFLEAIEAIRVGGERLNLLRIAGELQMGGARPTDVTRVFHAMLREAMRSDAPSREDVYRSITTDRDGDYAHNAMTFIAAVLPDYDLGKKPEAPASKAKPKRRQSRSKSTGKPST